MANVAPLSRATAAEWALTALLAGNLAWTTLCLGGYRPETMVVTSGLTALALLLHAIDVLRNPATPVHRAGWVVLPFILYAAVNVVWITPVRWLGWIDWFGWLQLLAVFWLVVNGVRSMASRRCLFFTLVGLALIGVGLGCYQRFVRPEWLMLGRVQSDQFFHRASGSFGIPNSFAALLLLILPACGALTLRRRASEIERVAWGWVTLVLAFGLVLTISRGAWIGLALALTAWPLLAARGNWRRRATLAAATLAAFLLIAAVVGASVPKVRERFTALVREAGEYSRPIMWRAAWQLFREHPVGGTGGGSYNVLFEKYRPEGFNNEPQWAHNDYLNTLSDYGATGFILFFGGVGVIGWVATRRGNGNREPAPDALDATPVRAALAVGLVAFAFQLFVDFHFKLAALAMAFAIVAGLFVGRRWPAPPRATRAERFGFGALAVAAAAVTAMFIVPLYRGEALRYRARQSIDQLAIGHASPTEFRAQLESARGDAQRAVAVAPIDGQAWAELSYATALLGRSEPAEVARLGREAEAAATRAVALGPVCAEFWIRRGVARDMQGRWVEAGEDFARAVALSPQSAVAWYYNADHLSRNPNELELARASLQLCLRLDPGNADGLALRQRLAIGRGSP